MPVHTPAPVETPAAVVTVIRYVSPVVDRKDTELLFALQVPSGWNVSTWRKTNSDMSDYRTDLVADGVFSVTSYPGSRSREQEYREEFRNWVPIPSETTVVLNGIRYDRFESSADGNTSVAYLAGTNSANERGYASVLVFSARDSNRFEQEDFEKVVSSFRYFTRDSAGIVTGEEIPHYDLSGKAVSSGVSGADPRVFDSSDWDTGEGGSAGSNSADQSSSSGSSSSGGSPSGGCHH
jgi:hypothetical protein